MTAIHLGRRLTDRAALVFVSAAALLLVAIIVFVYAFVAWRAAGTVRVVDPISFLFGTAWNPLGTPGRFQAGAIIAGSVVVVGMAVLLSAPVSLGAALFLEQTDPQIGERFLRPALELLVGIPSVVYGWVGLTVLAPLVRTRLQHGAGTGLTVLTAAIVLSLMILPTITSLAADALRTLPSSFAAASYALGATRWQTIWRVLLPAARAGITTGIVLGTARAMGEALAVSMVIGNVPRPLTSLLQPAATLTTIITQDLPNRALNPALNNALYGLAMILLLLSLAFIIVIRLVATRSAYR